MTSADPTRSWLCGILIILPILIFVDVNANQLYSEGGSFVVQNDRSSSPYQESAADDYADESNQYQQIPLAIDPQMSLEEANRQRLAKIVARLRESNQQEQQLVDGTPEMNNDWDVLKETRLKNWHKIKKMIQILLRKGKILRKIINEKCKSDENLWGKLWESFVEETNELEELADGKPDKHWKKLLLKEYSLYSYLCEIAEKTLKAIDKSSNFEQFEKSQKTLKDLLIDGSSGESNELTKKHKRIWLRKINDALVEFESATDNLDNNFYGKFDGEQEQTPEIGLESSSQKMAAVKKGQSEYVEFIEPVPKPNNRHKTPEWMEKRLPFESRNDNPFHFFTNSSNILFMAYLVVCCAGIVAGTVGGVYYYNHVRANRVDDPFNEFTRYSPAGPGKDKLKKSGSPTFGQTGDDALAYKAQLQHYQQQKQKILGNNGQAGAVVENISDNEEDTDEMDHNYSVFECPGLAPTGGDLEIQNPNFMGDAKTEPPRRAD